MKLELHPTKPFVIAELGTSCDGSVGNMVELARHAVAAGASAIKMQDHADQRIADAAEHPAWFNGARTLETRRGYIMRQCAYVQAMRNHGPHVPIIVSPFAVESVAGLDAPARRHSMPDAWKIASGQVTNHALIRACVETGKPIVVSSGMTTQTETARALDIIPSPQIWAILECTSEYPCPPERVQLASGECESCGSVKLWHKRGFSDHTAPDSTAAAIVALTRGARVFERHVCFDQRMYGSDAKNACTLEQFAHYCRELDRASRIPTGDIRDANAERLKDVREAFLVRSA